MLIRVTRAGINFADTHARENSYLARYELPLTPGTEVAGVVERDGAGFTAGQRVVSMTGSGGYAEYAAAPAAATFPIPDGVERRRGARAADPGADRLAPVQDVGAAAPAASPSSCTRRPAASARSPSSSGARSAPGA